ncbi:TPA: hypothetical protein MI614_21975 [Klebsiella pneumoniae]|nr:hypothetical protein [Klebsiella pneumoniae]
MWLMKTLLTSGCTNQRGAGQHSLIIKTSPNGGVFAFRGSTKTSTADLPAEPEGSPFPGTPLTRK